MALVMQERAMETPRPNKKISLAPCSGSKCAGEEDGFTAVHLLAEPFDLGHLHQLAFADG